MFKKFITKLKKGNDDNKLKVELDDDEGYQDEVDKIDLEYDEKLESFDEEEVLEDQGQVPDQLRDVESDQLVKSNIFSKLKEGLSKTRKGIADRVDLVLKTYKKVDEELFEEIEEILITADAGVSTTMEIIKRLRDRARERKITEAEELKGLLKEILIELLDMGQSHELNIEPGPAIILMVGVNGVGKTTSIGKIAYTLKKDGKKVLLAAGDTFRAAAIDQLEIWGKRVGLDVVKHQEGADPAAVIFDAIQSTKARKHDVLICDTAGRLHNKKNLMSELGKVVKVIDREFSEAKREILLVLDATTGQNALQQAKIFKEVTNISGIVLTKIDGTAKGGVVLAISNELNIPVKLVGVGEGLNDLQKFIPVDFVNALFGDDK